MIRTATHADEESLLALIREFYEVDGHEFRAGTVKAGLSPLLTSDRYGVVLLAEDPEPIGYAVVVWSYSIESGGRDALLDEIYVRTPGKGIGRALMERVFQEMRLQEVSRVFLETETDNEGGRAFYRSLGFIADDSVWMTTDIG